MSSGQHRLRAKGAAVEICPLIAQTLHIYALMFIGAVGGAFH